MSAERRVVTWEELQREAPELASPGRACLERSHLALLGTVRPDGSPRISPVEPFFAEGQLLLGAMRWTRKVHDLERDPRCTLHSAITGPDSGEDELKLYGLAIEADDRLRDACREGWWTGRPREAAAVFTLVIEEASLVSWDYERGEMRVRRWSPRAGMRVTARSYP